METHLHAARVSQALDASRGLIVHEWLERIGGAERVVDVMLNTFPAADLFCLWSDDAERYPERRVMESWLARTGLRRRKSVALPFMPQIWRRLPPNEEYDWMLVSSHLFAHHARFSAGAVPKFVYAHTPARYIWTPELDSRGANAAVRALAPMFQAIDRRRAQDQDTNFAANSRFVQRRIADTWGVEATVIYPPVITSPFDESELEDKLSPQDRALIDGLPKTFLLGVSRFVPYKRLDQVLAAGKAAGMAVVLAGSGPEESRLRAIAEQLGVRAYFVVAPSDAGIRLLMQRAHAVVFPGVEDFGIVPVEAMAVGTPVLVNSIGGASESVLAGVTGVAVDDFDDVREVALAVSNVSEIDPGACVARAREFSPDRFSRELVGWMRNGGAAL
jgi:glycosyltransferase involved in cell wall biosynthesis